MFVANASVGEGDARFPTNNTKLKDVFALRSDGAPLRRRTWRHDFVAYTACPRFLCFFVATKRCWRIRSVQKRSQGSSKVEAKRVCARACRAIRMQSDEKSEKACYTKVTF